MGNKIKPLKSAWAPRPRLLITEPLSADVAEGGVGSVYYQTTPICSQVHLSDEPLVKYYNNTNNRKTFNRARTITQSEYDFFLERWNYSLWWVPLVIRLITLKPMVGGDPGPY